MAGKKRKSVTFSYEEMKERLQAIPVPVDRFMLAASYANGTRVGEIVGIRAGDISVTDNFVHITTPVLKKRGYIPKRAPPISRIGEEWLADLILTYVRGKEGKLIGYSVRTAQRRFEEYFQCISHSFRHTRATHCFTELRMGMRMVAEYFRISPRALSDWVMRYGHLDTKSIEEHLQRRFK